MTQKEIMIAASRAGITKETIGEYNSLAVRYERVGKLAEALHCYKSAMHIHDTWGPLRSSYAMSPRTYNRVAKKIDELSN